VEHRGEFFRCKARSFVYRSPQGRPVLWQAGSSDRGRDFAAKHAEAVFAVHPTVERMRQYTDDLNQRIEGRFQRPPGSVKLIYGLQTVVAETRAEAEEKHARIRECIPLEGALAWISGHFGPDFSKYRLDEYVQNIEIPGIQGLFESVIYAKGGAPLTVKEAALYYAQGMGMPIAVGSPADIADQIEHYMDAAGHLHPWLLRGVRRPRRARATAPRPLSNALHGQHLEGEPVGVLRGSAAVSLRRHPVVSMPSVSARREPNPSNS
jgi:alkanesulfonate monooxygenase SsuD/methylene tetrahydromethanopterin reductase-like flavin-dependent oxidoreductase (luciferase family)